MHVCVCLCIYASSSSLALRALRGRSTRTYSALGCDTGDSGSAPAVSFPLWVAAFGLWRFCFWVEGLARSDWRGRSWSGNVPSTGVRRWLSLRLKFGGDVLACFNRSSVALRRASRASSSWVWVETACFLQGAHQRCNTPRGREGR